MSIFDYAAIAVASVMPVLAETATFIARDGTTIQTRAIPDTERLDMPGQHGNTMFQTRQVFFIAEADMNGMVPTSGDIILMREKRWRVAEADQVHPAAPLWHITCQRAPG